MHYRDENQLFEPQERSPRRRYLALATVVAMLASLIGGSPVAAATTTTTAGTAGLMAELIGAGVTTSNTVLTGHAMQFGTFDDPAAVMGLSSGLIMSSGAVTNIDGSNTGGGTSDPGIAPGGAADLGDADLSALLGGGVTKDAAILEFDFVPDGGTLYINYVVASEEYDEYVQFADVFAFYINGVNCAQVPGTSQPVSIGTVNLNSNSAYYNQNAKPLFGSAPYQTQADGFTDVFTCTAPVNVDVTNTAKIAIADNSDEGFDSWVMIDTASFSTSCAGANCPVSDLSVTAGSPTNITPGEATSVPITVTNAGPNTAGSSFFAFTPPASTTVDVANLPAGCTFDGPHVTCELDTLDIGTPVTVNIPLIVDASAPPLTTLTGGIVDAQSRGSVDADGATAASTVGTATQVADIEMTLNDLGAITPGGTADVLIDLNNIGPSDTASPTTVVYAPPAGVVIDVANLPAECAMTVPADGSATCEVAPLAFGTPAQLAIPVTVDADVAAGTAFSGGTIEATNADDPSPANNTDTGGVTAGPAVADLITTITDPGPLAPGASAVLDISTTNAGPSSAPDTTLVYSPPAGVTIDVASLDPACAMTDPADGSVTCDLGALAPGSNGSVGIPIVVDANAQPVTTLAGGVAGATSGSTDPNGDTAPSDIATDAGASDLSTTIADPGPLSPGSPATVSITTVNNGPSDAPGSTVIYAPPAGATIDSANLPADCLMTAPADGSVTCTIGVLASGDTSTFDVPILIDAAAVPGTTLTGGQASTTSSSTDANGDSVVSDLLVGDAVADMSVVVTPPPPIVPGETGAVTIDVTNNGPSGTQDDTTVVYAPPAGVTIDEANLPPGCVMTAPADGSATCTVAPLAFGETAQLVVPISVDADAAPTTSLDDGLVTVTNPDDSNSANDSVQSTTDTAAASSNLTTAVADPGPVVPGETATVEITTTNSGPSDASNTSVVYMPPAGVTVDEANLPADCAMTDPADGSVTCDAGTIANGGTNVVNIPVVVAADASPASTLSTGGSAGATSDSSDADGDSAAADISTADAEADISVEVTPPAPITPGETGNVTIDVTNNGPSGTDDPTTVVYSPPAGATIDEPNLPAGCLMTSPADGSATCTVAPLANGETASLEIPVTVGTDADPNATLDNGGVTSSNPDDTNPANDSASSSVDAAAAVSDLSTTVVDPGPVVPGESATIAITTTNSGPSDAVNTAVVYAPPVGVTIDSANLPAGCLMTTPADGSATCDAGTLAAGDVASFDLPVIVDTNAAPNTTLSDDGTAGASSDSSDPNGSIVIAGLTTGDATADLAIWASDPGPLAPGTEGVVTLSVDNIGPSVANNTTVVYAPPTGVTIDAANLPAECVMTDPADGSVTCDAGAVGASDPIVGIDIPVIVDPSAPADSTLADAVVSVSSEAIDPVATDSTNVAEAISTGGGEADLGITVESVPTLAPGNTGVIDIDVTNNGPSDSGSVDVTYALPDGVAFDASHPNPNGCVEAAGVVTCTVAGPIANGDIIDVVIPVLMLEEQPTSGPIELNLITLENASVADPTPGNDVDGGAPVLDLTGDSDGDGIADIDEMDPAGTGTPIDTDGDGTPDYLDLDSDNDGILDADETAGGDASVDSDGDGTPDYLDLDSDNDGIPDVVEAGNGVLDADGNGTIDAMADPATGDVDGDGIADAANTAVVDSDGDGVPNQQDLDSDNDGITDIAEAGNEALDTDGNGTIDAMDDPTTGDANGDGIADNAPTAPATDTDSDGIADYLETDSDNDGIPDVVEAGNGDLDADGNGTIDAMDDPATGDANGDGIADTVPAGPAVDTDGDGTPDHLDQDADNDGIPDSEEIGADPANPIDTDGDGTPDYLDLDSDNDGIPDVTEAGNADLDADGNGTIDAMDDPTTGDLDGDGIADNAPVDPALDTDGDGTPDHLDLDSDNDGITDIAEAGNGDLDADGNGTIDAMADPTTADLDGDGIADDATTTPLDSDGDGTPDHVDLDSDNDGITDIAESGNGVLDADGNGTIDAMADPATGDVDGDGIADAAPVGPVLDTDGDGTPDHVDLDSDNDGITDIAESGNEALDTDGDGTIDAMADPATGDVDGDGIADAAPVGPAADSDGDGTPDHVDLDSDNDGIADVVEAGNGVLDADGDGTIDAMDDPTTGDVDGDGIADAAPAGPVLDTDGDGTPDFADLDSDNDGINDIVESGNEALDTDGNGTIDAMDDPTTGDVDGDGIADAAPVGPALDSDGDGTPDYADSDSDNDGIPDVVEAVNGNSDTDGDGTPDYLDQDADNDGIPDSEEIGADPANPIDTDGDGTPDYLDLDSDNDGIPDVTEAGNADLDADGNGTIDAMDDPTTGDLDGDGIADNAPVDPALDTDGDGTPDHLDLDSDNDGITDIAEAGNGDLDADGNGTIDAMADPTTADLDGDGIADNAPVGPAADTDGDGTPDYADSDSDNDGIADILEVGDPINPSDFDGDGIPDYLDSDADGDGIADTFEAGDDPLNPLDTDQDGIPNYLDDDSDGDGIPDAIEGGGDAEAPLDSDGDGILDFLDTDADNDGIPDSEEAGDDPLADFDGDGIPDYRDAVGVQIIGQVFIDLNRNGAVDAGENDISGVDVMLMGQGADGELGTSDDVLIRTATTASPYILTDVADGTYHVVVDSSTLPAGIYATDDLDGQSDQLVVIVVNGADVTSQDFGQNYVQITGMFTDVNGNPVANTQITVTDSAGNVHTVTTNADGSYVVEGSAQNVLSAGTATISGTGNDGSTVTATLDVSTASNVAPDLVSAARTSRLPLAFTGASMGRMVGISLGLLLMGMGMYLLGYRPEEESA